MLGGTHRGPVGAGRQRRTVRLIQILLVLISGALMMYAGYSWGRLHGYRAGIRSDSFDRPRPPSVAQTVVLVLLGGATIVAAASLEQRGAIRLPTPARLDELAGRAEDAAIERAESSARSSGHRSGGEDSSGHAGSA
jgi:hypothetical protein